MSQAASVGANFVFGCDVGTGAVENGAQNPNNACQTCQPNKTTKGWSNLTSATGCGPTVIAAGNAHTCAVVHGGAVQCWGANLSGQLGDNASNADTSLPVQVFGLTTGAQSVVAGSKFTCAVVSGGVQCWGDDGFGALGYNPPGSSPAPVRISSLSSGVEKISAGWQHACAVVSGGVKCWGDNMAGDLGNNSTVTSSAPVQVDGITAGAQSVAAGFYHSCAVVNGGVQCWGGNQYGQLGNNSPPPVSANPDFNSSLVPAQVYGVTSGVRAVAAGDNFACALVGTGVWCWGDNSGGALGNNSLGNNSFVPVQVNGLSSGVTAIAAGAGHACAIVGTGVWCWGYGVSGQLGNNSTTSSPVPVAVNGLGAGATAIAAGAAHTCALVNGNVRCWGSNSKGQLGNNSTEPTSLVPADPVVFQ
jgi:alpha-tubulin suppressor-like RCC1 family protein